MLKITNTRHVANDHGLKILVHGPAGAGKTRLCATTGDLEHTLIISAEGGLLSIRDWSIDVVQVGTMGEVYEVYEFLKTQEHQYQWVCLDSISEIAEVVLQGEKLRNRDARRAYGEMADTVFDLIRGFRNLPLHVLMTAKQGREEQEGRILHAPLLPGRQLTLNVAYLFDEVFALRVETNHDGEVVRVLQTGKSRGYDAKDRSGALAMYEPPDLAAIARKINGAPTPLRAAVEEGVVEEGSAEDGATDASASVASAPASAREAPAPSALQAAVATAAAEASEAPDGADPGLDAGVASAPASVAAQQTARAEPFGAAPAPQAQAQPEEAPSAAARRKPQAAPPVRVATPEPAPTQRLSAPAGEVAQRVVDGAAPEGQRLTGDADEARLNELRRRLYAGFKRASIEREQIAAYIQARCAQDAGVGAFDQVPLDTLTLWAKELEDAATQGPNGVRGHVAAVMQRHEDYRRRVEAA